MTLNKKEKRQQVKALKKAHNRRAKLIDKVAKARAKFEKQTRKLQEVEKSIADLSHDVFGSPVVQASPDAGRDAGEEAMAFGAENSTRLAESQNTNEGGDKVTELPDDPAASE
jgi:hypothetical protein